ncbi:WD40 repeat domain-containing protein [Actinomycetota bacterium Odt1-20B]
MTDVLRAPDRGAFEAKAVVDAPRQCVQEVVEDVLRRSAPHDVTTSSWCTCPVTASVLLGDPRTGRPLAALVGHKSVVNDEAFAPAAHRLATAADDKTVRLWDVNTGKQLRTW